MSLGRSLSLYGIVSCMFMWYSVTHGDTLIVDKVSFSSTVKETFKSPIGFGNDDRPDNSCWFTAFLSVNALDLKQDCLKNINNDNELTFPPGSRMFFHTVASDKVGDPVFQLSTLECAEQNCNPSLVGGDDCKFDASCSLFGVSTGDMARQMGTDIKLRFERNRTTTVIASLPGYQIKFNLTWVVDTVQVAPGPTPAQGSPPTPVPGGVQQTPSPTPSPGEDPTAGNNSSDPPTTSAPPDNTVTIVIASVVGLVVCLIIVLVIVYVVMRARTQQAQLSAGYPSASYQTGNMGVGGITPTPADAHYRNSGATSRSFTESSQYARQTPSYTTGGYSGAQRQPSTSGYPTASTGDAYGMMQLGQPQEAYGNMPDPTQAPIGGFRSAAATFSEPDGAQAGYSDVSFNTGSATELPDLNMPPATRPW